MACQLPVAVLCRVLGAPRSSVDARRAAASAGGRPAPATSIRDRDLVELIRQVLDASPFAGEGDRKVRARLRRQHGRHASGNGCCACAGGRAVGAPADPGRRRPHPHDGTIIPDRPNQRWDADATMAWTRVDGWVWVFCVDHDTAQAWAHVAKVGDRFAALQPVDDAVIDRWGRLDADVARGLALRHGWGPQYRSAHFTGSLAWLGISDDPAFLGEPETNGCAERWIRTLKEQCLWAELHDTVEELRQAVAGFVERYNSSWLLQRHSHQTPKEAGGGNAGAGQRRPAGRLGLRPVAAPAGGRVGRLDPDPALAGGRHPRHRGRWGSPRPPTGRRARPGGWCDRGHGGRVGVAVPAQPRRRRLAAGEQRTARLLGPLERQGWVVLHDLAVPGSRANLDHLVIGPGGVFVVDSKQFRGRLQLDPSGRLWHGRYPLAPTLRAVSFEADRAAQVLADSHVVVPIVAVHGAQVPWGKVVTQGVPVVSARRLPSMLRTLPAVLGPERVAALAHQARSRFRAAA
jgi:putative transposase